MSCWYSKKKVDDDAEFIAPPRQRRAEVLIDAWQFDGPVLNLGFVCRRLHRSRLADIPSIERLRWKVFSYYHHTVRPRREEILRWMRELGEAFFHHDYGTTRYEPNELGYMKSSVLTDTRLPPLMQLAEIPDITEEKLACGRALVAIEDQCDSWLRRSMCVDAALMCAFYANSYIRAGVDNAGRGSVRVNDRNYLVRRDWLADPLLTDMWPRPEDATFSIGP